MDLRSISERRLLSEADVLAGRLPRALPETVLRRNRQDFMLPAGIDNLWPARPGLLEKSLLDRVAIWHVGVAYMRPGLFSSPPKGRISVAASHKGALPTRPVYVAHSRRAGLLPPPHELPTTRRLNRLFQQPPQGGSELQKRSRNSKFLFRTFSTTPATPASLQELRHFPRGR